MEKIVVFTGAGVSADSGISTFRDANGLWANYRIEDVCTPEALLNNRNTVIEFYNLRRKELLEKEPNTAHYAIVELEKYYDVEVVTQNIDDLHECAGSTKITHLHGEVSKLRSSVREDRIYPIEGWRKDKNSWQQKMDATDIYGDLLRPFVVFFGESVPMYEKGIEIVKSADIFIVVGTSLAVYPAASLLNYVKKGVPLYLVDPSTPLIDNRNKNAYKHFKANAAEGMPQLLEYLIKQK